MVVIAGYTSAGKTCFDSEAEAIEYAKQKGYTYTVVKRNERKVQTQVLRR